MAKHIVIMGHIAVCHLALQTQYLSLFHYLLVHLLVKSLKTIILIQDIYTKVIAFG